MTHQTHQTRSLTPVHCLSRVWGDVVPSPPPEAAESPAERRERWDERAAIMEFDGGLSPAEAGQAALLDVLRSDRSATVDLRPKVNPSVVVPGTPPAPAPEPPPASEPAQAVAGRSGELVDEPPWPAEGIWATGRWRRVGKIWHWTVPGFHYENL